MLILGPKGAVMIRIQVKYTWNPRTDFSDVLTFQLKLKKKRQILQRQVFLLCCLESIWPMFFCIEFTAKLPINGKC